MTNKKDDKAAKFNQAVETLINAFNSGDFGSQIALKTLRPKAGMEIPADKWSIGNNILMAAQGTSDARGFLQWQEAGRKVKKGSKAIYIFAPKFSKAKQYEEVDEDSGEVKIIPILTGFYLMPVFRVEDTDGEPLPQYSIEDLEIKTPTKLFDVCKALNIPVKIENTGKQGAYGYYLPSKHYIALGATGEGAEKVLAHELAHALTDTKKFPHGKSHNDANYRTNEIIAETTAAIYMAMHGKTYTMQYSYNYIKSYAKTTTPTNTIKKINSILKEVERIISVIMDTEEKINTTLLKAA